MDEGCSRLCGGISRLEPSHMFISTRLEHVEVLDTRNISMDGVHDLTHDFQATIAAPVAIAIRLFAGASYLDLMQIHGSSRTALYDGMWEVVDAIDNTPTVGPVLLPMVCTEL